MERGEGGRDREVGRREREGEVERWKGEREGEIEKWEGEKRDSGSGRE